MDLVEGIERRQSGWPLSAGIQCPAGRAFCAGHSWIAPRSSFLAAARSRVLLLGLRRRGLRRPRRVRLHERYVELPAVSIDSAQRLHSRVTCRYPSLKAGLSLFPCPTNAARFLTPLAGARLLAEQLTKKILYRRPRADIRLGVISHAWEVRAGLVRKSMHCTAVNNQLPVGASALHFFHKRAHLRHWHMQIQSAVARQYLCLNRLWLSWLRRIQ